MALGVIYLALWPFITITTRLLYAFVYERWLKCDLDLSRQWASRRAYPAVPIAR